MSQDTSWAEVWIVTRDFDTFFFADREPKVVFDRGSVTNRGEIPTLFRE
jgi:hypothetical protein